MKFLGIGPLELALMMIVVLLLFKPSDLIEGAKKLGQFINRAKNSEYWKSFKDVRKSVSQVGQNIISDNGLEELKKDLDFMPDLNKFRSELDQIGFTPNVSNKDEPIIGKQNGGSLAKKLNSKEISNKE